MEKFVTHKGTIGTLNRSNVDTDQIIPKQFLKSIKRTGFGENLFYDWRYLPDGKDNPDFELNKPEFKNASVLVVQNNFGCGSSREHAVWAIAQDGYKVIIAPKKEISGEIIPGFADIFKNNCGKNSILTIELSENEVSQIFELAKNHSPLEATADVEKQTLTIHSPEEASFSFNIDPSTRERMLQGLDDIGTTLQYENDITQFEETHSPQIAS